MTDAAELDALVARLQRVENPRWVGAPGLFREAAAAIVSLRAEVERFLAAGLIWLFMEPK